MSIQLVLAGSSCPYKKINSLFSSNSPVHWLFLGSDYETRNRYDEHLTSNFSRIDIARLQNSTADRVRLKFVKWLDSLNFLNNSNLTWWFSLIPSRNVFESSLFQNYCYIEVINELWLTGKLPDLIIVESSNLMAIIKQWALTNKIATRALHEDLDLSGFFSPFKVLLYLIYFITGSLIRYGSAWATKVLYNKGFSIENKRVVIIDTFVHKNSFDHDGIFNDRYFPYLYDYLQDRGKYFLVHPVLAGFRFKYFNIYKKMRLSPIPFIVPEDYLKVSDYIYAAIIPLLIHFSRFNIISPGQYDFSDLLRYEQRAGQNLSSCRAALIYRLFIRLGEQKLIPDYIISWYENQVIDKALIAGVRESMPSIKILGAQIYVRSPNLLNTIPSESEWQAGLTPDILLTTSPAQCLFTRQFCKELNCKSVAALRYNHVFNQTPNTHSSSKNKVILVLLSFDLNEGKEILSILNASLSMFDDRSNQIRLIIKGHPDNERSQIQKLVSAEQWLVQPEIFVGDLALSLASADVVVSSTSSSMVEAAAYGIPVIFIGRQTMLNHNLLADINIETVTECYTPQDLVNAFGKYLTSGISTETRRRSSEQIREFYFTPVNDTTMQGFLA